MNFKEAAQARSAGVRAPADRPSQRRSGEDSSSGAHVSVRVSQLELRAPAAGDAGPFSFQGYASVTGRAYEMYDAFGPYNEIVNRGAFAESLGRSDLDVPLVLGHDDMRRIARTVNGSLHLSEDDGGLLVRAELDPDDLDVQYIVPKLRAGLVDEMSFKFRITDGQWSPNWDEFHINSVDIHRGDVSIVGTGANPYTNGSGLVAPPDLLSFLSALSPEQRAEATSFLAPPKPVLPKVRFMDREFVKIPLQ